MSTYFEYQSTAIQRKHRFLNAVISIGYTEDPPSLCNRRHYTEYPAEHFIIIYTESGSALLTLEDDAIQMTAGTAVWLNSAHLSSISTSGKRNVPWRCRYCIFSGEGLTAPYLNAYDKTGAAIKDFDQKLYCEKFDRLMALFQQGEPNPYQTSALCYELVMFHCEMADRNQENAFPSSYLETTKYLKRHYAEPIVLEEVAQKLKLSSSQIHRLIRKYAHTTPMKYVSSLRFKKACILLHSTNKTLDCIASEVGLNDVRSLIRLFKKEYGMTPGKYRHSVRPK